ncbi:DUF1566 domain-containing protein [Cupriavidus basilensis]|uniref:Lcl domain-containing protein n=1 Tax=Cupriavidus basilensis TaxID=68895 RepID=UPI0009E48960|nr:DUF1566 domain-containing protein [Cupriavidus basilensis]
MNAITTIEASAVQTTISQVEADSLRAGDAAGGGFYAGQIRQADGVYALIVAPKGTGEHAESVWNSDRSRVDGALSYFDGAANTAAMAEAGSDLAKWALGLQVNGNHDWYLPARDELELIYRNLKPTAGNYAGFRDGENPSSAPAGYAYTEELPTQTRVLLFQEDGSEVLEAEPYWSSTQSASNSYDAWVQGFNAGFQSLNLKSSEFRARAVRRLKIQ